MSALESLQAELAIKMGEIDSICEEYGYDATPTLLLRHSKGSSSSILIGNDSLSDVVVCISELGDIGKVSEQSPSDAVSFLASEQSRNRRGYYSSKVIATEQGHVAEEEFYDAEGNVVGYYAYGSFDTKYPYQGNKCR